MNQKLLNKFFSSALILGVLLVGSAIGQQTTPTPIKRNSPFAPNPKKKGEQASTAQAEVSKIPEQNNEPKIIKVESEKNQSLPNVDIEESKSTSGETEMLKTEEFESRSVAKKTLEIAKRASAVEAAPTEIYKVGLGDVLFISLQNAPAKETTYFTILNDGNIDYPLAGEMIQVLGLTVEEIEELLESKIKLYENPQVSVKIREHNSHVYTVLGLVEKSGEKTMSREAIPLFVVKAESLVNSKANQVSLKRGNQEKKIIDLTDSKSAETLVYPGDILEFGINEISENNTKVSQFYFIGGEINSGGRKDYITGITLTQAILESGGLKRSNVKKVVIRRKNNEGMLVPTEFDLKSIKDGKAVDPVLEAGDTIEIGN